MTPYQLYGFRQSFLVKGQGFDYHFFAIVW